MAGTLVLVIGPDWRIRRLIQANLEAFGFEVRSAVNGRHGLHTISEGEPDLILLDTEVPDAQLDHLVARLRGQGAGQVPIIVLAAEPPAGCIRQDGTQVQYLLKPFAVPALLDQVRAALQMSRSGNRLLAQDA
jgi:two-component system KDP operon response regulator KdpE